MTTGKTARDPFAVDEDRSLAELELAWSDAGYHAFSVRDGLWCAVSSAGEVLTGDWFCSRVLTAVVREF
jgi:hypothetical protein